MLRHEFLHFFMILKHVRLLLMNEIISECGFYFRKEIPKESYKKCLDFRLCCLSFNHLFLIYSRANLLLYCRIKFLFFLNLSVLLKQFIVLS